MQRVLTVIVWTSDDAWAYALDDEQLLALIAAIRQTTKPTMVPQIHNKQQLLFPGCASIDPFHRGSRVRGIHAMLLYHSPSAAP
jgi:hypothetical protein